MSENPTYAIEMQLEAASLPPFALQLFQSLVDNSKLTEELRVSRQESSAMQLSNQHTQALLDKSLAREQESAFQLDQMRLLQEQQEEPRLEQKEPRPRKVQRVGQSSVAGVTDLADNAAVVVPAPVAAAHKYFAICPRGACCYFASAKHQSQADAALASHDLVHQDPVEVPCRACGKMLIDRKFNWNRHNKDWCPSRLAVATSSVPTAAAAAAAPDAAAMPYVPYLQLPESPLQFAMTSSLPESPLLGFPQFSMGEDTACFRLYDD